MILHVTLISRQVARLLNISSGYLALTYSLDYL